MTDLQRYEPGAAAPRLPGAVLTPANDVDSWVQSIREIGDLSGQIADTEFVPDSMRRKPAAVTACILAGRELGIGPMTSLQHIQIIKGKVGQSPHLMRALIQAAGHDIAYGAVSDASATVYGRRRGETDWTEVSFTAAQARTASINLGGYPEDKLIARATARLARRKFADVIAGMPYLTDELGDDTAPPGPSSSPRPAPADAVVDELTGAAPTAAQATGPAAGEPAKVTPAQLKKLGAIFTAAGVSDRTQRLHVVASMADRALGSSKDLTQPEASELIDNLEDLGPEGISAMVSTPEPEQGQLSGDQADAEQDTADDAAQAEA